MQISLITLLCALSVLSAGASIMGWQVWPLFFIGALVMLVIVCVDAYLRSRQRPAEQSAQVDAMPSPSDITAALERARAFLNDERGALQPPRAITVACSRCDVTELYPVGHGNDAAQSPHLLTHPDHCVVIGARQ